MVINRAKERKQPVHIMHEQQIETFIESFKSDNLFGVEADDQFGHSFFLGTDLISGSIKQKEIYAFKSQLQ